jgi:predicted metal-dependent hydrolase
LHRHRCEDGIRGLVHDVDEHPYPEVLHRCHSGGVRAVRCELRQVAGLVAVALAVQVVASVVDGALGLTLEELEVRSHRAIRDLHREARDLDLLGEVLHRVSEVLVALLTRQRNESTL